MTTKHTYLRDRSRRLRQTILETLATLPDAYMQPESVLMSALRHTLVPEVTEAELHSALEWLEEDALIHGERSSLTGTKWCITGIGRARCAEL